MDMSMSLNLNLSPNGSQGRVLVICWNCPQLHRILGIRKEGWMDGWMNE